jgi:hypothetical protein
MKYKRQDEELIQYQYYSLSPLITQLKKKLNCISRSSSHLSLITCCAPPQSLTNRRLPCGLTGHTDMWRCSNKNILRN